MSEPEDGARRLTKGAPSRTSRSRRPVGTRPLVASLAALCLSYAMLQTFVMPALPVFQSEMETTVAWATWVVTGFTLVSVVATLLLGAVADGVGYRKVLLWVSMVFAAATFGAAFAPNIETLIALRAVQGVGGAVFPIAYAMVATLVPEGERGTAIGIISGMFGVGGVLAFPLGGVILDVLGWRYLFVIGGALIVLGALAVLVVVPRSDRGPRVALDASGAIGLSLGLSLLLLAMTFPADWGWTSPRSLALAVLAVATLGGWMRQQHRTPRPLIEFGTLRRRPVKVANLASFVTGFAMLAAFLLAIQFAATGSQANDAAAEAVGYGFAAGPAMTGWMMVPATLVLVVAPPLTGRVGLRWGYRNLLVFGMAATAAGCLALAVFNTTMLAMMVSLGVLALGCGVAFASMPAVLVESVSLERSGAVLGTNIVARQFGAVAGAQVSAGVLTTSTIPGTATPTEMAYVGVFLVSGLLAVVSAYATHFHGDPATRRGGQKDSAAQCL